MLKIKLIDGAQFKEGLLEFTEEYGFCLCEDADAITVRAVQARDGLLTVTGDLEQGVCISYSETIHFFRGFGRFLQELSYEHKSFHLLEKPQFTTNGEMCIRDRSNVLRMNTTASPFQMDSAGRFRRSSGGSALNPRRRGVFSSGPAGERRDGKWRSSRSPFARTRRRFPW